MNCVQQLIIMCSRFDSSPYHDLEPGFHQVWHTLVPHCVLDDCIAGVLLEVKEQRSEVKGQMVYISSSFSTACL